MPDPTRPAQIPHAGRLDRDIADPGLNGALRQVAIANHRPAARLILDVFMRSDESFHLRFDGLGKHSPGPFPQQRRQGVLFPLPWLFQGVNRALIHGVSFPLWG